MTTDEFNGQVNAEIAKRVRDAQLNYDIMEAELERDALAHIPHDGVRNDKVLRVNVQLTDLMAKKLAILKGEA
jgi:hypothetical protein